MKIKIMFILLLLTIFLSGCSQDNLPKLGENCYIDSVYHQEKCCLKCEELNYVFLTHKQSYGMFKETIEECYCYDGNNTKKIW